MLSPRRLIALLFCTTFLQGASLQKPAPLFTLSTLQHEKVSLGDLRGQVVLINFWASWCAPCRQELPALNALAEEWRGKKVRILAINVDEDTAAAEKALADLHLSKPAMTVLWDKKSKTVSAYDIETMPYSYIVDAHGIVRYRHQGFRTRDPALWREELARLKS